MLLLVCITGFEDILGLIYVQLHLKIRHYQKFCVKANSIRQKTACRDKHN